MTVITGHRQMRATLGTNHVGGGYSVHFLQQGK